jgi:hypothetical protein
MKKKVNLIISLTFLIILNACSVSENICSLPPNFSEADLFGTWVASRYTYPKVSDAIVIRNDGLYKQIVEMESPPVFYESEWQPWHIEYSTSGIAYLHMEGMRLCGYVSDIFDCSVAGGGDFYWYDFCTEETTQMPTGEGILIVTGTRSDAKKTESRIILNLLSAHPEDSVWWYELEDPK